jgi:hypothetical protein
VELTIEDIAGRAGVDLAYVRRLVDLGALGPEGDGYREKDAHVTALLHMWEDAGLSAESILAAAESGELSLDFLESPGWELPPRLDRTYRELAEERSMPVDLLQAIQRAMGFVPPEPDDLARPDDVVIADLVRVAPRHRRLRGRDQASLSRLRGQPPTVGARGGRSLRGADRASQPKRWNERAGADAEGEPAGGTWLRW